jgi:hypothetical protein
VNVKKEKARGKGIPLTTNYGLNFTLIRATLNVNLGESSRSKPLLFSRPLRAIEFNLQNARSSGRDGTLEMIVKGGEAESTKQAINALIRRES